VAFVARHQLRPYGGHNASEVNRIKQGAFTAPGENSKTSSDVIHGFQLPYEANGAAI
jgi:hypothetical protein